MTDAKNDDIEIPLLSAVLYFSFWPAAFALLASASIFYHRFQKGLTKRKTSEREPFPSYEVARVERFGFGTENGRIRAYCLYVLVESFITLL